MHAAGHAALALAAGACVRSLVGVAFLAGERSTAMGDEGHFADRALLLAALGLGAAAVKATGGVCATYAQGRIAGAVAAELRLDALDAWLTRYRVHRPCQVDHGVHEATTGVTHDGARGVAVLTARVRDVEVGLGTGLLGGARAMTQLLPLVVALAVLAPALAACAAAVFVPFGAALGAVRRAWRRANARMARDHEALIEAADEAVRHADVWTVFGAQAKAREAVASLGHAIARGGARVDASAAGLTGANEVLGAVALVVALLAARTGWLGAAVDGARLFAFAVVFFLAYKPLRELTEARLALARSAAAMKEMDAGGGVGAAAEASEGDEPGTGAVAGSPAWNLEALEMRGVTLARGALREVNARVEPGTIVAICGATGVGKTTLLRVLLGLEAPRAGEIRYGGIVLAGAAGPAARPFTWVPQEAPILAGTLDANVRLAEGAGDVRDALVPLGAGHLIESLGDVRLGAGGRAVSGGERQWIALARAVATRQPVLLLDEPTSGLDPRAQERVLGAIARLRGARTVILVTHQREPLAIADTVIRV